MISERLDVTKTKKQVDIPSYRAFNFDTEEMVYFYKGMKPAIILIIVPTSWAIYPIGVTITESNAIVHSANGVLMRGSGYRDISGLEIYDGDIIENLSSECNVGNSLAYAKAEVYFKNGLFHENYLNQPLHFYPNLLIKGNIFENTITQSREVE